MVAIYSHSKLEQTGYLSAGLIAEYVSVRHNPNPVACAKKVDNSALAFETFRNSVSMNTNCSVNNSTKFMAYGITVALLEHVFMILKVQYSLNYSYV